MGAPKTVAADGTALESLVQRGNESGFARILRTSDDHDSTEGVPSDAEDALEV
jgi:hypothetical protein